MNVKPATSYRERGSKTLLEFQCQEMCEKLILKKSQQCVNCQLFENPAQTADNMFEIRRCLRNVVFASAEFNVS